MGSILALLGQLAPEEDWGWGPEPVKLSVLALMVALELTAGLWNCPEQAGKPLSSDLPHQASLPF